MADNLFDQDQGGQNEEIQDFYSELVGEDKKYKDAGELAKAKHHADQHIQQLESELSELRQQSNSTQRLQEVVDQLQQAQQERGNMPSTSTAEDNPRYERDELEKTIENIVTKKEQERTASQNLEQMRSKLKESLGDNFIPKLVETLQEVGMSREDFDALAKRSPTAAMRILGQSNNTSQNVQTPPPSSVSSEGFSQRTQTQRTKSHYDQLRKQTTDPFKLRELDRQEHDDAMRLGSAFFDT